MNVIEEVIGFISSKFKVAGLVVDLVKLEAKLASLCIVPLIISVVLAAVLTLVTWITLMVFTGYAIFWYFENMWFAIGGVLLIHIILLGILLAYMMSNLRKVKFEKTRAFLSRGKKPYEQSKKSRISHSSGRKKIMARTSLSK